MTQEEIQTRLKENRAAEDAYLSGKEVRWMNPDLPEKFWFDEVFPTFGICLKWRVKPEPRRVWLQIGKRGSAIMGYSFDGPMSQAESVEFVEVLK
jgi:hypothetical protein